VVHSTVADVLQSPTVARHASSLDEATISRLTGTTSALSFADSEDSGEGEELGEEEGSAVPVLAPGVTVPVLGATGSAEISDSGRSRSAMRKALTATRMARSTNGSVLRF
jgi:hypothetical protein